MTIKLRRFEMARWYGRLIAVALLALTAIAPVPAFARDNTAAHASEATQRVALSPGQAGTLSLLSEARPKNPSPLFLFTDPNKDPDDLSVLVIARYLQEQGFIDLRCVVTTLGNRDTRLRRALFARKMLDDLGLEEAKVGTGRDYGFEVRNGKGSIDEKATEGREKDHQVFLETPFAPKTGAVASDGLALLIRELAGVPDGSAILLINAGMADVAALLEEAPELVRQKAAKAVIMGGIAPELNERGFVVADKRAYNNSTHQASADYTYARVQELGIPLVVVSKEAAYAAAAPRSFYEGMAATGHPIGIYLRDQQKQSLDNLWTGIQKGHLPPALTSEWFFETFTDLDISSPPGMAELVRAENHPQDFERVWRQVSKFNLYDPLALLAATPGVAPLLFQGDTPEAARSTVSVVTADSITDSLLVQNLLAALAIASLNP